MDLDAMTTLLGDPICNIEEDEYWEACQHTLKCSYELRANEEDEEGGIALNDDEDGSEDKSDSVVTTATPIGTTTAEVM